MFMKLKIVCEKFSLLFCSFFLAFGLHVAAELAMLESTIVPLLLM